MREVKARKVKEGREATTSSVILGLDPKTSEAPSLPARTHSAKSAKHQMKNNDTQDWWDRAVARNRVALLQVVAVLFVYAGLDEGGAETVPRRVWRRIVRLLRPAESAVRRLIVIAARGIKVDCPARRAETAPPDAGPVRATGFVIMRENVDLGLARAPQPQPDLPAKTASAIPVFALSDPPRRFDARGWNGQRPFPVDGFLPADADEEVSAAHICRRLLALRNALDDLPGHAARLARRNARRALPPAPAGARPRRRVPPAIRPGLPPGHRRRPDHRVDDLLAECHSLARDAERLDSS